jgi:L-ascorbate metabolism protein UlaG (beta-lactamase superfamily)
LRPAPSSGIAATWIGHSSVVLQQDGANFLFDPVWSHRLAGGFVVPRKTPPGRSWSALPRIDALVVSHNHYDHLDAPTIQRLPRETPVFCPAKVGPWFRSRGFRDITELSWWERATMGGHRLTFVPAQHFSGRTLFDRDATLWGGWVIEGAEGSVSYFAGDSGAFEGFREIGDAFPRIDLCMMPIGAYEPRWFMHMVHVDPPEAGQAFLDTRARVMLPIHWGTFALADEPVDAPPRILAQWWEKEGLDPARLKVPKLGETVTL